MANNQKPQSTAREIRRFNQGKRVAKKDFTAGIAAALTVLILGVHLRWYDFYISKMAFLFFCAFSFWRVPLVLIMMRTADAGQRAREFFKGYVWYLAVDDDLEEQMVE